MPISHVFSDVDIGAVRQSITQNEHAIHVLHAEIEEHASAIRQLQSKVQGHLSEIRKCKGMITLARHMPPEILASIFEECVRTGWTRSPLIVSQVCSSWRKAARIPTVWSHVYVRLDNNDPYRRTCLWLERSQGVPIVIDVDINDDTPRMDRILTLLISEASRWKELNIKSVMLHPVNRVLQACTKPAPQLQSIGITVLQEFPNPISGNGEDDLVALTPAFAGATQLRHLRIGRNLLPGPNTIPSFVTHLTLVISSTVLNTTQSVTSMLHLLQCLPWLAFLSVEVGHHQTFNLDVNQEQFVELPHLRMLILMGLNNIFSLLAHLRSRNLIVLRLRSSLDHHQAECMMESWMTGFLESSNPPLRSLELRDIALDPSAYDRILPFLSTVEEIRLHDSDISDSTLIKFNDSCPLLQRLDLRWCGRLSGRALVELIRSRSTVSMKVDDYSKVNQPIAEVTAINCSFVKEEDILDLAKLTTCRLIHKGSEDFCYSYGCCENIRYRKRLKQKLLSYLEGEQQIYRLVL